MLLGENRAQKGVIMSTGHFHRTAPAHPDVDRMSGGVLSGTATKVMAVLRIATGFIFLWAFLDKLFGLNYSTPSGKSWISGGSPTKGFLSSVDVGPLESTFHSIAGTWWADSLFMLGLLAIGVTLIAGVFLRLAAVAGVVQLGLMWVAEFPLAQTTSSGQPSGSSNPLVDYHVLYAVVLIVLAVAYAGTTWGLGRRWAQIPFVQRNHWML